VRPLLVVLVSPVPHPTVMLIMHTAVV